MKNILMLSVIALWSTQVVSQETDNSDEFIYTIVEQMPIYKSCDEEATYSAKVECTQEQMYLYFKKKAEAIDNSVRGIVYFTLTVDRTGKAVNPKILRGILDAPELDRAVIDMVKEMPLFIPGKQRGKEVNVQYTLPVKFK